jgi:serine/threonine protein kinase
LGSYPLRADDPEYIGDYELLDRLGTGGMGTVFLARTPREQLVAIKVVRTDLTRDPEFLGRFRSEVNRARQVPPFCTAAVIDADVDHDPPYLVVEYVDGPNLADVVRDQGPLSPSALHSAALGIATALAGIHGAGVIHRDLKPGNVLFALGGLKVIDFGIARPLEATSQHTRTDQMVGTVAYMAPERFDEEFDRQLTPAADVFAWGAVVTFAGTGRTPFAGDSAPATAMRILTQPPRLTGLPAPLRDIVARSLAKEPKDRPTARELVDLLLAATPPGDAASEAAPTGPLRPSTAGLPGHGEASKPRGRVLKRVSVTVAALAVLLLAGFLGYSLPTRNADRDVAADKLVGGALSGSPSAGTAKSAAPSSPSSRKPTSKASPRPSPTTLSAAPQAASQAPSQASPKARVNASFRNLALAAEATASSSEGDHWRAANAVDGDRETRWSSGFSDPQWLRVDLGARWQISEVRLAWENAHATAYRVELSTDGTTWKSVYSTTASGGGDVTVEVAKLPARFVRMYGTKRSTDYGYSLLELDVR